MEYSLVRFILDDNKDKPINLERNNVGIKLLIIVTLDFEGAKKCPGGSFGGVQAIELGAWNKANPAIPKRLIKRLIDTLIYTPEGLKTYYVTAKDVELELPISKSKRASELSSGALSANSVFPALKSNQPDVSFPYAGSLVG